MNVLMAISQIIVVPTPTVPILLVPSLAPVRQASLPGLPTLAVETSMSAAQKIMLSVHIIVSKLIDSMEFAKILLHPSLAKVVSLEEQSLTNLLEHSIATPDGMG